MKKIFSLMIVVLFSTSALANQYTINVEGMVCDFCAQGIEKKLNKKFKSITNLNVDLDQKRVIFESEKDLDQEEIKKTIVKSGYNVESIEVKPQP